MAMVTVPILKNQSINAAMDQAEANIRTTHAMRRQARLDLRSRIVSDVASVHDADRGTRPARAIVPPAGRAGDRRYPGRPTRAGRCR